MNERVSGGVAAIRRGGRVLGASNCIFSNSNFISASLRPRRPPRRGRRTVPLHNAPQVPPDTAEHNQIFGVQGKSSNNAFRAGWSGR